jgi:hypothetical protein
MTIVFCAGCPAASVEATFRPDVDESLHAIRTIAIAAAPAQR